MENYSYSSYPDSVNSSPRSREVDCENASWDEPPSSNYKVKFMCSYGGKIHPRPHDNQLSYVGGDTKILSVDRNIRFSSFMSKLSTLYEADVCFKYQLPGEDLDALISVTNDEDLELMMLEYDRLQRASNKPARLRLFLFPFSSPADPGCALTLKSDQLSQRSALMCSAERIILATSLRERGGHDITQRCGAGDTGDRDPGGGDRNHTDSSACVTLHG
nr:PB1 domain-containing protein [Ipomoea batatas]